MGLARGTLYGHLKRAKKEKEVAAAIAQWQELDNTLSYRALAKLLQISRHQIRRVMHTYGLSIQRKGRLWSAERSKQAQQLVKYLNPTSSSEVSFSPVFEVRLKGKMRLQGCFAFWKATQHCLALIYSYDLEWRDLSKSPTGLAIAFGIPEEIWKSSRRKTYGDEQACNHFLISGYKEAINSAGTSLDRTYEGRFTRLFKQAVADKKREWGATFLIAADKWIYHYNIRQSSKFGRDPLAPAVAQLILPMFSYPGC